MKKLPAKYVTILLPFCLSMMMSCLVSLISTIRLLGITEGFFGTWFAGWMISWVMAFPTVLVVLPLVKKFLSYIVESPKEP